MTRGRRRFVPPPSSPRDQQASRPKPNRLSRSFRQTQTAEELGSPKSQRSDFKTPTRISGSRVAGAFSAESPHNDSDFQQDIIWDAGSPSPGRLGKRGQTLAARVVDISDIVSRIAPKHGRPRAAEPTLQQWIGDSATIPCTPDVQVPKPKKKSPRPTGVDDLLKLAKQFDFNMFHWDEEAAEDVHQQSLVQNHLLGTCGAKVEPAGVRVDLDLHMEDDLDCLFDGPTQPVSGTISQVTTAQPSPLEAVLTEKPSSLGADSKDTAQDFDDDWDDDDLLNDSLVIEMTQNPQNFIAPKLCSAQAPASGVTPVHIRVNRGARLNPSEKTTRQRVSFSLWTIPKDTRTSTNVASEPVDQDPQQSRISSSLGFSIKAGSQQMCQLKSEPQKSDYKLGSVSSSKVASSEMNRKPTQSDPNILHEDLDLFFSSDLVWDDPADDDLLCEMCEDLETQIQSTDSDSITVTLPDLHASKQRAALQASNQSWDHQAQRPAPGGTFMQPFLVKQLLPCASGGAAGGPLAAGSASGCAGISASGSTSKWSRVQSAATVKDQFTFKKPDNRVPTVSNKVLGKCSAAEIELKKQQAMERRRQRLKAAQNLNAPT